MSKRMPPEVLEYLRSIGQRYGKLGGQTAAKNMTAAERSARAKKASIAAAKKRMAERLARERATILRRRSEPGYSGVIPIDRASVVPASRNPVCYPPDLTVSLGVELAWPIMRAI